MASFRRGRINEEVMREMSDILREVKDPRVNKSMVSVTAADVSPDLKYAKIYFSVLGDTDRSEIMAGLKSASGFIRKQIAARLNLRQTPELNFIPDDSIEYGANIARLLKQVEDDLDD